MEKSEHVTIRDRKQVHAGTCLNVYVDRMDVPGGKEEYWDHVEHRFGAAAILPVLPDGRVILVRQFRPSIDRYTWEIPAGARDGGTEDPYVCAMRELREETGYSAKVLEHLFSFHTAPAYCDERIEIYLAKDIYPVGEQELDPSENIDVHAWDVGRLKDMIADGIIMDGKTIATIMYLK